IRSAPSTSMLASRGSTAASPPSRARVCTRASSTTLKTALGFREITASVSPAEVSGKNPAIYGSGLTASGGDPMRRSILSGFSILLLSALAFAAVHAVYRIELKDGSQILAQDRPVPRGSVMLFHSYPEAV